MSAGSDSAPSELARVIADYVRENEEELFTTREECLEWSRAHYAELVDGTLGGNLLSKYSMIGRFYTARPALDYLEAVIAEARGEAGLEPCSEGLRSVMDYLRAAMLDVPLAETMAEQVRWTSTLDVEAWTEDGFERPLEEYRFEAERSFDAIVEADRRSLIQTKVDTFGEHPSGLGKFTRTMFARDLRRSFVSAPETD